MVVNFIPIKYGRVKYPQGIIPTIKEIPAHFDQTERELCKLKEEEQDYSLHTEYSAHPKNFDSPLLQGLNILREEHHSIPHLWRNEQWALEFVEFILRIVKSLQKEPKIIEIHPPRKHDCKSISDFLKIYAKFEEVIFNHFPNTTIVIENRTNFRISTAKDIIELSKLIKQEKLKLKIVLDIPQLFTSQKIRVDNSEGDISSLLHSLRDIREDIVGIHLCGKSHSGKLDKLLSEKLIPFFLKELYDLLDDNKKRYFLPEVNTNFEVFTDFIEQLRMNNFKFIS